MRRHIRFFSAFAVLACLCTSTTYSQTVFHPKKAEEKPKKRGTKSPVSESETKRAKAKWEKPSEGWHAKRNPKRHPEGPDAIDLSGQAKEKTDISASGAKGGGALEGAHEGSHRHSPHHHTDPCAKYRSPEKVADCKKAVRARNIESKSRCGRIAKLTILASNRPYFCKFRILNSLHSRMGHI
jgi:hypothetical protein